METLRNFGNKVIRRNGRRTVQEWISLQFLSKDGNSVSESNVASAGHRPRLLMFLYSVAKATKSTARSWDARFPSWRGGMAGFSILGAVVLFINLFTLIWAASHLDDPPYATITMRSCKSAGSLSTWVKLAINFFSTTLLAGSNYCMQILSSPTRNEIDTAHARSSFLNIGILSWRNVKSFRKRRILLLLALLMSSLPLHFAYNSTVVVNTAAQVHDVVVITPDFLSGGPWYQSGKTDPYDDGGPRIEDRLHSLQNRVINGQARNEKYWENISVAECKDSFNYFRTDRGSVLLVTREDAQAAGYGPDRNDTGTVLWFDMNTGYVPDMYWNWTEQSVKNWRVTDKNHHSFPISYCLSLRVPYRCRLQVHIWLLLTVVVLNTIKLACMLRSFWEQRGTPMVTVGDAIASFLQTQCEHSEESCLLSQRDWEKYLEAKKKDGEDNAEEENRLKDKAFHMTPLRYYDAVSFLRWVIYATSCIILILVALSYFNDILVKYRGDHIYKNSLHTFWKLGFGNLYIDSSGIIIPEWCSISTRPGSHSEPFFNCGLGNPEIYSIILGSFPQILISVIYIALNHHLTVMIQLRDWTRLVLYRQPLRVSNPEPESEQVSTYWLSLPYQYSIVQIVSSALLGWLASQAIFFYRNTWYDNDGHKDLEIERDLPHGANHYGMGYSALGVLCSIVFGLLVFLVSVALGFRKCAPGLPLGPTNSLVIAAACHPPDNDRHAARKKVQWGAITTGNEAERVMGHCTITSRTVEAPKEGRLYV